MIESEDDSDDELFDAPDACEAVLTEFASADAIHLREQNTENMIA